QHPASILLDCRATTISISKRCVTRNQLHTTLVGDKKLRVEPGDNQIIETKVEVYQSRQKIAGVDKPQIDWSGRRIEGTG
ncbi:hypothetical protein PPTG_24716, partial [Phytophthora nicotianae INRA-310]